MPNSDFPGRSILWDAEQIDDAIVSMTNSLVQGYQTYSETIPDKPLVLIGIRTGGAHLAKRIQSMLAQRLKQDVPLGLLDITLYRDDMLSGQARHILTQRLTHTFRYRGGLRGFS